MPHPTLENRTAFHAEALHLVDEELDPLLTPVVKASFDILPGGSLALSPNQDPLDLAGHFHPSAEEPASYRYEPEVAPLKLATDVVFVGHAHAPNTKTTHMDVGVRVGALVKSLRVFGERVWFRSHGARVLTAPVPFERMPITYERAFGGWDRSAPDPGQYEVERRNPVGRGLMSKRGDPYREVPAPNIEDIAHPLRAANDRPAPAGLGFVSPDWLPRAKLAGTFDDAWQRDRLPCLPSDFDRRFHNAASSGLVAPGYLRGDEDVAVFGMVPEGRLAFRLPAVPPPTVAVHLIDGATHRPKLNLDTVVIDLDMRKLWMIWRNSLPLFNGPHDLRAIVFDSPASRVLPRSQVVTGPELAANQPR